MPDRPKQSEMLQAALTDVAEDILSWKVSFLDYAEECRKDATLEKVAHYVATLALHHIGRQLAILGHSDWAAPFLNRPSQPLTPGVVLVHLDATMRQLYSCHGQISICSSKIVPRRSLAEQRAALIVASACDEQDKPIFAKDDIPTLIGVAPDELDKLYTAAAMLNRMLPPGDTGSNPPAGELIQPAVTTAHSPEFSSVRVAETVYRFTPRQRAVVAALWQAWEQGTPWLSQAHLQEAADTDSRIVDLFKENPAWGKLIIKDEKIKDLFRISIPEPSR